MIDHRLIADGDERALLPEEIAAFSNSVVKVRRASGAVRIVARELLQRLGHPARPIAKSATGAPVWPDGVVGSLAHDRAIAVAAVAKRSDFLGLGVDVEPAEALDADLVGIVATDSEWKDIRGDLIQARLLFAVKEAVYKAVHPLDGAFLEHHDVEVSLVDQVAAVRGGRRVMFRYGMADHLVVVAYIPSPAR